MPVRRATMIRMFVKRMSLMTGGLGVKDDIQMGQLSRVIYPKCEMIQH